MSSFADRVAFARLVTHVRTGKSPDNAEIARAVGRSSAWVTKWAAATEPPTDFRVHAPLAAYLGVGERWLVRGEGEPPMPELYRLWIQERGREVPRAKRVAEPEPPPTYVPRATKSAGAKGGRKRRAG